MSDLTTMTSNLPAEQEAIRRKCFHPSGSFVEFRKEEVEQSIPSRFEQIVRMYPDRVAVKTENHVVTYAELNRMANRVTRALVAQQRIEAEPVALLFEKGIAQIAAMLGVLNAGKFFVLLDASFPRARIATILKDSQARLLVYNEQTVSLALELENNDCRSINLRSTECGGSNEELRKDIWPKALASIVYTSGSGGQPKGVMQTHQNLLHRVMLFTGQYHICPDDRVSLLSFGTSNSVTHALCALLNGATLLPFDVRKEGVTRLADWMFREEVTLCLISSPLFRSLCDTLTGEERFPNLRLIGLRSETVHKRDFDLYRRYFPTECVLSSSLASTESGNLSIYFADQDTEIAGEEVPVGYTVEDKEILLVDDNGEDVGSNQVGEIVVRSKYLSPGYWRNPGLTRDKFNADPRDPEERIYHTGDLGLMRSDGCLIHKGRKDFRVKIRGYGVDIGEVEKIIREYPAVGEAVVLVRHGESGEARLVAYFTSAKEPNPTVDALRRFLKEKLSDHMIPSAFVRLEAMPLTSNGKVDRKALPDERGLRPELETPYFSSKTLIEKSLTRIWADVLGLSQIGTHDNFFDLGGHSLSASRIVSQIAGSFHVDVPLIHFFESPTIEALASRIEKILEKEPKAKDVSVKPMLNGGRLPLSFAQQRLWFLDQLEPRSCAYNVFFAYQLKGELNVVALEQSFNEILRRHEVLRTVFQSEDGSPVQVVLPTLAITIPVFDLRGTVSEEDRSTEVRRLVKEEAQRSFDLARGPLLRITLLRLAEDEYLLLRAMHHIVSDAWSTEVLFRELARLYEAFSNGQRSPLAALPIQYADYAVWQQQWLRGEILESQLSYWKQQLENLPTLRLPTDRPRPPVQTSSGARQHFTLSESLSSRIKSVSRRHGVTVFMVLLAAFQTLLSRYSGQTDIVIGSPVAGRNRSEFENLIGFFLNMLVLRTDLSGNPTFVEAMTRVRDVCLGALSHQELAFEKLVEELHPERDLSQNPLFQVTFAFQNTPRFAPQLLGVRVNEVEVETGITRFDLHCFMEEKDGRLKGTFDYSTELFNADTIERLIGHFETLLEGVVADPNQRISELPILTEAEKRQLLVEWNNTQKDYPKDKYIHELFEEQVERSPDAVAAVFEEQHLTYLELNGRANQLAHWLRKLGVRPDVPVGIFMERSLDMVVSVLGILKAGGAHVPLDPSYPQERLDFMLEDSRVAVLLTQQKLVAQLMGDGRSKIDDGDFQSSILDPRFQVICMDTDWEAIAQQSEEVPISEATAENLAYIIYTSGSTGKSKGTMNTHGGISNRLLWMQDAYHLDSTDRVLQKTPFSFDVSVWEFFWPLLTGATLVVARPRGHQDPSYLVKLMVEQAITTLHFVPSMLQAFLEAKGVEACSSLKRVICSGEALSYELQQRFFVRLDAGLHNLYGPTEAAVDVTSWACQRESNRRIVPIGRPVANTQIYLLDHHMQPVPIGVCGELYIGGIGVARGYLNRPALTAENFIPNPFSDEPGARLYKTGDLARYLPDGAIEFLGRIDDQVKIRGFRIELGEIETVLSQHPEVRETVVVAHEDTTGDRRLVTYVVPNHEPGPSSSELRSFLKQKLPEYMLPSAFVFLNSLPLAPNGKVDRRALPQSDPERVELRDAFVAPRTAVQKKLSAIWTEVLKLERLGIHDNFFHIGGHSLKATQVMARVRAVFEMDVPLRTLFEKPTVEELALVVMERQAERPAGEQVSSILAELESMSDDEAQRSLAERSGTEKPKY